MKFTMRIFMNETSAVQFTTRMFINETTAVQFTTRMFIIVENSTFHISQQAVYLLHPIISSVLFVWPNFPS